MPGLIRPLVEPAVGFVQTNCFFQFAVTVQLAGDVGALIRGLVLVVQPDFFHGILRCLLVEGFQNDLREGVQIRLLLTVHLKENRARNVGFCPLFECIANDQIQAVLQTGEIQVALVIGDALPAHRDFIENRIGTERFSCGCDGVGVPFEHGFGHIAERGTVAGKRTLEHIVVLLAVPHTVDLPVHPDHNIVILDTPERQCSHAFRGIGAQRETAEHHKQYHADPRKNP